MKKIISFIVMISLLLIVSGCAGDTKTEESLELDKEIIGTWSEEVTEGTDQTSKIIYTFNEDGTYELVSSTVIKDENGSEVTEDTTEEGQYTIDVDKLNLKILKIDGNSVDEPLQAIDNTTTGEPNSEYEKEYSETQYDISISGDTLTLKLGDTEYNLTKE